MFLCSTLDFNKPRTTGTKILKLLEDNVWPSEKRPTNFQGRSFFGSWNIGIYFSYV